MYSFSYFKEKDQQVILDFLKEHPFVVLTGSFKDGKQMATQVPVFIEEKNNDNEKRKYICFHFQINRGIKTLSLLKIDTGIANPSNSFYN